jgi:hypothetical protein
LTVLFDQFTDTRFSYLYSSQLRFQAGYELAPWLEIGALMSEPTNTAHVRSVVDPTLGIEALGAVRQAQSVGGYAATEIGTVQAACTVGYRTDPDTLAVGGRVSMPLMERVAVRSGVDYEAHHHIWATWVGLEYAFR